MKRSFSIIAFIGGLIALAGIILSLFVDQFGWWNFYTISNNNVVGSDFLTGFYGNADNAFNEELTYLIPGILASLGALMCLTSNKYLAIIGSVLIFAGVGMFLILLGDSDAADLADALDTNIFWDRFGIEIAGNFTGVRWQLGYGLMTVAAGGIIGLQLDQ